MSIAYLVSTRATCDRKKVGAVLVKERIILATGYNGSASGMDHCDDIGHELKQIEGRDSCVRTIHAESNAIDFVGAAVAKGATLYSTVIPCYDCAKRIVNIGIDTVYYAEYYASRNTELVEKYFSDSPYCSLQKWEGEFITPGIPEDVIQRTLALQNSRAQE